MRTGSSPSARRRSRPGARRAPRGRPRLGQHAAAEAAGAGDDPAAGVDHLDEQRAAAEPALERARLVSSRGRGGQPRDLDGARRAARGRARRRAGRRAARARRRRAPPRRPRSPRRAGGDAPGGWPPHLEPEADAAHGVDQRRLAELAPQVGDVAVDDVGARLASPPHTRSSASSRVTTPRALRSSSSSSSASRRVRASSRPPRRAAPLAGSSTRSASASARPAGGCGAAAPACAPSAPRPRTA